MQSNIFLHWLKLCSNMNRWKTGQGYCCNESDDNEANMLVNSLWPCDVIWRHWSRLTLAQGMACCLTASSHYLNQCWLIINDILWHSPEGNWTGNAQEIYIWCEFKNCWFNITATSTRPKWVKLGTHKRRSIPHFHCGMGCLFWVLWRKWPQDIKWTVFKTSFVQSTDG